MGGRHQPLACFPQAIYYHGELHTPCFAKRHSSSSMEQYIGRVRSLTTIQETSIDSNNLIISTYRRLPKYSSWVPLPSTKANCSTCGCFYSGDRHPALFTMREQSKVSCTTRTKQRPSLLDTWITLFTTKLPSRSMKRWRTALHRDNSAGYLSYS